MRNHKTIAVIIPAFNEQESIARVVSAVPEWVDRILVVNNGSTDDTVKNAAAAGAQVVFEPRRGYGAACLAGIAALPETDVVVFLDGDYSDYPREMDILVDPILDNVADLVIGSRMQGLAAKGALSPQSRFGNWLACRMLRFFWGVRFTDLGPFRAIRFESLQQLNMTDPDFGWTVEMQIKAIQKHLRIQEVPVHYRKRIGQSKISGTLSGAFSAGCKIISTILKFGWQRNYLLKKGA